VTFCVLNGAAILHRKKTIAGQTERLEILKCYGIMFDGVDDLIDAGACLVTAKRVSDRTAIVLGDNTTDQRSLRMEIVA
jgi:hypothetical protein